MICFKPTSSLILESIVFLSILLPASSTAPNRIYWATPEDSKEADAKFLIPAGRHGGNTDQYVIRVKIDDNSYPGRFYWVNRTPKYFYSYGGREYEVLDTTEKRVELLHYPEGVLQWVYTEGSRIPKNDTVPVGFIAGSSETIYLCRIYINSGTYDTVPGRYQESEGECIAPHNGVEVRERNHEMLVLSPYGKVIRARVPPVNQ